MAGPFNRKGTGWMAIPRELQSTFQCPNGSASSSAPRGTLLGLILFNVLINDIVDLSTPLASWQGTPSSVVQLIHLVEGMPSLGTLTGLRSGPVWTSLNSTWPRPRTCTWVGATPSIGTDREWMVWEQPCGGLAGTVWWVDWQDTRSPLQLLCHSLPQMDRGSHSCSSLLPKPCYTNPIHA